jgi:hypothetical protein
MRKKKERNIKVRQGVIFLPEEKCHMVKEYMLD